MMFDGKALWAEVQANYQRLEACPDHAFVQITPGLFGSKWVCTVCKGEVDGVSAKWYLRGREHASFNKEKTQ